MNQNRDDHDSLAALDHAHVWHPFTPMRQWRRQPPLIIERADRWHLIDTKGRRYIDGTSSLWCNLHGHRVPAIDRAIRRQLGRVAHSTYLGASSEPGIRLAARLCAMAPRGLNKVFYSDAGATALELAFKMAVGYWYHRGERHRTGFIGLQGAYHGDTTGAMSVGYTDLFHRPFADLVFPTRFTAAPDACRATPQMRLEAGKEGPATPNLWPSEDVRLGAVMARHSLSSLETMLRKHADQTAAIVVEPVMQGAAGMLCQPPGFLPGIEALARQYGVLLIADEVATGFCRTGSVFACEQEGVQPDLMCLAKGITGGYLPLAATLATDEIEHAFCGQLHQRRTLFHGHTYTGNPLACAAALASADLIDRTDLVSHVQQSAAIVSDRLDALRPTGRAPHVIDVRQRGLMIGIEMGCRREGAEPLGFDRQAGTDLCASMRDRGVLLRPLGNVIVLMPIPAMDHATLSEMLDVVIETVSQWRPD